MIWYTCTSEMITTVKLINISPHTVTIFAHASEIYSQQISSIQRCIINCTHRAVH